MPCRRVDVDYQPALGEAGSAFLRLKNRNLIFLFGGENEDEAHSSSDLIAMAMDIDRLIWWVAGKFEGGNVAARINSATRNDCHRR